MNLQQQFEEVEKLAGDIRLDNKDLFLATPEMTFGDYKGSVEDIPITLDVFQAGCKWSDEYPTNAPKDMYCALGMCGEAGEAAEVIKKCYRNNDGKMTDEIKDKLIKELGDVLWYISSLANYHNIKLSEIAKVNQIKLVDRLRRGKIRSAGDDR